jgi:hypothetical protein
MDAMEAAVPGTPISRLAGCKNANREIGVPAQSQIFVRNMSGDFVLKIDPWREFKYENQASNVRELSFIAG